MAKTMAEEILEKVNRIGQVLADLQKRLASLEQKLGAKAGKDGDDEETIFG